MTHNTAAMLTDEITLDLKCGTNGTAAQAKQCRAPLKTGE